MDSPWLCCLYLGLADQPCVVQHFQHKPLAGEPSVDNARVAGNSIHSSGSCGLSCWMSSRAEPLSLVPARTHKSGLWDG